MVGGWRVILEPGSRVNRYEILEALGRGGFASTYLALDPDTGARVALKFPDISQLGDPATYERFRRELNIGQRLQHPDIPRALSLEEYERSPYMVMEYLEGRLLSDVLREEGPLPLEKAIPLIEGLLETLAYCHSREVFHRDLKPENLLLGADGRLKIIDFGISFLEGAPRVTWRGFSGLMGTPAYMAPEQILGERGGAATDIYAVGILFYEFLAGRPPFRGDNPLSVMYQHLNAPLPSIPGVPPAVMAVLRRALRRRKEQRYASAEAFRRDLEHLDEVAPASVPAEDPPLRAILPGAESDSIWITLWPLGLAILVAIVFLGYFLIFYHR